jgi:hypothetical protein
VDRIAAHPRDRLIIIRCRDAEHANIKRLGPVQRKRCLCL